LAGRFSEIGERIFALGRKKASQICTGNWKEMSIVDGKNTRNRGKPLPTYICAQEFVPADCHTGLHKQHVPPAYMTNPGVTYTGANKPSYASQKEIQNVPESVFTRASPRGIYSTSAHI
jgi:hypothetical protein